MAMSTPSPLPWYLNVRTPPECSPRYARRPVAASIHHTRLLSPDMRPRSTAMSRPVQLYTIR